MNSSDPKCDWVRSMVDSLKPGDRIHLIQGGYEITVGMPSDKPDEPHSETKGNSSVADPGAWFE